MRDDRVRLMDMLEAIERIEKYAQSGQTEFLRNELIQNWIIHHLQILGEAAFKVSKDFQQMYPSLPWSNMTGMRHILVHNYFEINTRAYPVSFGNSSKAHPRYQKACQCVA